MHALGTMSGVLPGSRTSVLLGRGSSGRGCVGTALAPSPCRGAPCPYGRPWARTRAGARTCSRVGRRNPAATPDTPTRGGGVRTGKLEGPRLRQAEAVSGKRGREAWGAVRGAQGTGCSTDLRWRLRCTAHCSRLQRCSTEGVPGQG